MTIKSCWWWFWWFCSFTLKKSNTLFCWNKNHTIVHANISWASTKTLLYKYICCTTFNWPNKQTNPCLSNYLHLANHTVCLCDVWLGKPQLPLFYGQGKDDWRGKLGHFERVTLNCCFNNNKINVMKEYSNYKKCYWVLYKTM